MYERRPNISIIITADNDCEMLKQCIKSFYFFKNAYLISSSPSFNDRRIKKIMRNTKSVIYLKKHIYSHECKLKI